MLIKYKFVCKFIWCVAAKGEIELDIVGLELEEIALDIAKEIQLCPGEYFAVLMFNDDLELDVFITQESHNRR